MDSESDVMLMADPALVDRMVSLSGMREVPRAELEWLVAHGDLETYEPGAVVAPKGERIDRLFIVLSGYVTIRVDRGAGPRRVMEWGVGEATGMLPYSRMTAPPGDNYVEEETELLAIHTSHFPELINACPTYTARMVHMMLDRARSFNTSDLQDEKMISLGKLAAGLAHELNNPASALVRGAKHLRQNLVDLEATSRDLGATRLDGDLQDRIRQFRTTCESNIDPDHLSPIEYADREQAITEWLLRHRLDTGCASSLVESSAATDMLESLSEEMSAADLNTVLRWVSEGVAAGSLADDIEESANRIYELVSAVKRLTYMDQVAEPGSVDVEAGLRDTIRVLSSKADTKGASITLDVEPNLPQVCATGGELNQVWMNLIDNAVDAITAAGRVEVHVRRELDGVAVRVVDDGPGIPPPMIERIFDPFFTTKPPGEGTGLGLDLARRIVRRYQGEIYVQSQPGMTEFTVRLMVGE